MLIYEEQPGRKSEEIICESYKNCINHHRALQEEENAILVNPFFQKSRERLFQFQTSALKAFLSPFTATFLEPCLTLVYLNAAHIVEASKDATMNDGFMNLDLP